MKNYRLHLRLLLFVVITTLIASLLLLDFGQTSNAEVIEKELPKPIEKQLDPELKAFIDSLDQILETEFKRYKLPGAAIAIVFDTTYTFIKTMGLESVKSEDSIHRNTVFRLASTSKGLSSILAAKVLKTADIDWNTPVSDFVTGYHTNPNKFTDEVSIEHILSHSAGYPYQAYTTMVEAGNDRTTMFNALFDIPLSRKPGEIHSYQNVAFSLIEPVLEYVSDTSFHYLMQTQLFDPLGMQDASMTYDDFLNSYSYARPHSFGRNRNFREIRVSPDYYNVAAAGGINASINDMVAYTKALLGQHPNVIPDSILNDVFNPRIRIAVKQREFSSFKWPRKGHYGLGFRKVEYPSDTIIYHGGYANGYKSQLALDRNKNIAICILTNAPSRFANVMATRFFKEYKLYEATTGNPSAQLANLP